MGKLILLRHSESMWNKKNIFTGWVDVALSNNGIIKAINTGKKISEEKIDILFTSTQIRAIETAMLVMAQNTKSKTPIILHNDEPWTVIHEQNIKKNILPIYCDKSLNERYYGKLQGKNKNEIAKKYGSKQTLLWRRSYDIQPPGGESLKDTTKRTIPFFKKKILPLIKKGKNILISAHGNSLRSIIMYIENIPPQQMMHTEIGTGEYIMYTIKTGKLEKINKYTQAKKSQ